MKFGIFYEHQLPRPWTERSEQELFNEALDQVELADRLGLDSAWEVEHHFLEEYSHSSAPEVFLAACSQRTKQIRLGHGIVLMPPGYNHPARVAERIATLDLVSNGRVEFGTGEASSLAELGGRRGFSVYYGQDFNQAITLLFHDDESYAQWRLGIEALLRVRNLLRLRHLHVEAMSRQEELRAELEAREAESRLAQAHHNEKVARVGGGIGGQHEDRQEVVGVGRSTQLRQHVQPVQVWHVQVEQHQVDGVVVDHLERSPGIGQAEDLRQPDGLEHPLEHEHVGRFVIDDEHP